MDIPSNKVCVLRMYRKYSVLLCILYVWTFYVRQCHIFENVLLYVVTDGPFGLVFINKLVKHIFVVNVSN